MKALPAFFSLILLATTPFCWAEDNVMSFMVGANQSPSRNGYGGTQHFLGLHIQLPFNEVWLGQLLLQADSLGSQDGIEIRKGSYMFGVGRRFENIYVFASIGVIDTMLIDKAKRDAGGSVYNPYTGTLIPNEGVYHDERFGYHVSIRRPFMISSFGPYEQNGFLISPYFSYAALFGSDDYGAVSSLGISFDLWTP